MQVLAPSEHDRDLDLRALVEKAHDMALLRLVVVNTDLRPELDLLDVDLGLVLPCELGLLLLLVPVLAVVHHPRDRRIGLRGDFHEVEALRVRILARFLGRLDPDLLTILAHQAHLGNANVLVDPVLRLRYAPVFRTASRPQRLFTKLVESSSWMTKNRCKQRPLFLVQPARLNPREPAAREGEGLWSAPTFRPRS